ncbi:Uncharacterised protein [Mycobacterium tuberculosis]|uniref:Uncharacterized protein n=1 Tax=Mycobacterium tuberculosis TaxID=1773 RepID=A0A655AMP1_MYCTX|nr:Uncharacterised protein [Mycobacterium tuberculosis]CKS55777.1 Uncharacterised protein [Mycobacterium tuberculosis]CKT75474.1 Uncharacterised protein [Mycobacterium tuberculosis]
MPTVARCSSVIRTAQPSTDPTPQPVCSSTRPTTTAVRNSWIGPDSMTSDAAAKATAMVATAAWPRPLDICDTNQPTREASGRATASSARITHCAVVGVALMKTSPPSVTKKTAMRQPSTTAQAANIGADRGHSRRHRPRMVSTEGRPRFKNQLSASTMAAARAAGGRRTERLMPAYPSAGPCLIVHLLRGPLRCSGSAGLA